MVSKPGRVIVGMDPHATSMAAAALGARLAGGMDATLELFVPVYNSQVSLAHFENREHLQHARDSLVRRHLEHLEERLASASIGGRVECHAAWDHPHEEALIRRVLERGAELLLVELPDGVAQGGRPLSAAQWQLVRHCPAPVLLTRGGAWREAPVVVAAVDPGGRHGRTDELDTRILKFAERIALCAGGTVHAFHAWERTLRTLVGGREEMLAPGRPDTGIEQRHREAVYSVLAAAEVAPARVSLVEGRPRPCRAIVTGSRRMSW
jgi:universal stress protein E